MDGVRLEQRHGKARVRVGRAWREPNGRHHFVEWSVSISLLSDCLPAYTHGDNSDIVATDTMKNTVYVKAKECMQPLSPEDFAIVLGKHFTSFYQQSGFEGFIRDKYTILPETRERMLATEVTASWRYPFETLASIPAEQLYFMEKYMDVKKVLIDTFFGPTDGGVYSPSVQSTLYHMAKAVGFVLEFAKSLKQARIDSMGEYFTTNEITEPLYCVLWMAPFLSGGGYSSEAWSYILALNSYIKKQKNPIFKLSIEQHGDLENVEFWDGLPLEIRNLAIELYQTECRLNQTIVICHSEPGAWYPPLFQTLPCPPNGYGQFQVVIGRTMFETDRVNVEHVRRCNKMDLVWVPTDFHKNRSADRFGVFDPLKVEPLDLASIGKLVLGSDDVLNSNHRFVFLSVFKWEYRKGWDVLLRSYLKEFSKVDDVALYLLTNAYHSDRDFGNKIVEYVENSDLEKPVNGWAPIYVIDSHIAQVDLPRLYRAANAFVLPSRGEGWGRPIVEAMAMSLPVIVTNWSGPTEYLRDGNSYPLGFEGMSEVKEGPFKGHMWAEPSVDKLQFLMKHVWRNRDEAKTKGMEARLDMMRRFSPEIVAEDIIKHLQQIVEGF
ncbi:hypothetical protein DH2020_030251 [Rehmannia glutinosa]|uniref:factor independent urate hydroxylase n=1 Tax=Rehmannia glutinosa TaxID=99300 RepID=A0ABR0VPR8_REHGL